MDEAGVFIMLTQLLGLLFSAFFTFITVKVNVRIGSDSQAKIVNSETVSHSLKELTARSPADFPPS